MYIFRNNYMCYHGNMLITVYPHLIRSEIVYNILSNETFNV